jgi:RNA polymerase sigma factor (sigma-70 family)
MTEAAASGPPRGRMGGIALRGPVRLLSEERLSQLAARGDQRAFEEIFRRYHQQLYRFCLATVSNPQDAQEALQNTMVKVMRALPGEEREIKLKPWLYRIARNEAVETIRRRRDTAEPISDRIVAHWEISEAAAARARLRDLFADLEELPERQRSALVMRELAGLDFAEIGGVFGTTPAVARQTLYEARQGLRQMDEGREMSCETVRRAISDADGRVTRRRDIRAHVRGCPGCRAFRGDIARRREDLTAIAPLPLAVSLGLAQGLLAGQASGAAAGAGMAGGGVATALGLGAGKVAATSAAVKSAAAAAIVAVVGVGAADRSGIIDLPASGGDGKAAKRGAAPGENVGSRAAPSLQKRAAPNETGGRPVESARRGVATVGPIHPARAAKNARTQKGRPAHSGELPRPAKGRYGNGKATGGKAPADRRGPPRSKPAGWSRGRHAAAGQKPPQVPPATSPSQPTDKSAPTPQAARPPKAESTAPVPATPEATQGAPSAAAKGGAPSADVVLPPDGTPNPDR